MKEHRPSPLLILGVCCGLAWLGGAGRTGVCVAPPGLVFTDGVPLLLPSAMAAEPVSVAPAAPAVAAPAAREESPFVEFGKVRVERATRTVLVPATWNQRSGLIEYALVTDYGKTHESLLITKAAAADLQAALLLVHGQPTGTNAVRAVPHPLPAGSGFEVTVEWKEGASNVVRRLEECMETVAPDARRMERGPWMFSGSMITVEGFAAHFEGSLISLIVDPVAILNNPRPDRDDDEIHRPAQGLPAVGTEVQLRLRRVEP